MVKKTARQILVKAARELVSECGVLMWSDAFEIGEDDDFIQRFGLDDVDLWEIQAAIEAEHDVKVSDGVMLGIRSIREIADFLERAGVEVDE